MCKPEATVMREDLLRRPSAFETTPHRDDEDDRHELARDPTECTKVPMRCNHGKAGLSARKVYVHVVTLILDRKYFKLFKSK